MPSKKLDEVDVVDNNNIIIRKVLFHYSYFYGTAFDILPVIGYYDAVPTDYKYNRLRLDSITISSANNSQYYRYRFDYNTNGTIPCKYTFSQDHYGYYNGINNSTPYSFIPNLAAGRFTGGDRRVKPGNTEMFSLKSITYPEGGKTVFQYENNTAGVWNIPSNLLDSYQDDNIAEKSANIYISSYNRFTSFPSPDYTTSGGTRVFTKYFTVDNTFDYMGLAWDCSTTFGMSSGESSMPYSANNVHFLLEKVVNGFYSLVKEWNNTDMQYPYVRTSTNKAPLNITPGNYRMTVELTYSNPGTPPDAVEPYNLNFTINWRELNPNTKAIYTGGLRIKEIDYYSQSGQLDKRKNYKYINPNAYFSIPNFTSGRAVSIPKYFQHNVKRLGPDGNVTAGVQYGVHFYSNSVLPLETTSGSYSGYEYVDEYDVNVKDSTNMLKTNYQYSFSPPYFSQYYVYQHLGAWEPAEWMRGKLLHKNIFKGNNIIKREDYTYYDWSPHLVNGADEDYVQEINTDLISYLYLQYNAFAESTTSDFIDDAPSLKMIYDAFFGFSNNCFDFNYGAANHYFDVTYNLGGGQFCTKVLTVPYFQHFTGFDKPKTKVTTLYDDNGHLFFKPKITIMKKRRRIIN